MSRMNTMVRQSWPETILKRPAIFLAGSFGLLFALCVVFLDNSTFDDQNQSTRLYLLSTIAQAVAAVFGIIISLVLVGVQLTAQHYSQRANRLVLGDHLVMTFTVLNIITIVTSLTAIADAHLLYVPWERLAKADESAALALAGVCLVAVPFVLYRVSELMTPVGLAQKLLESVTRESVLDLPYMDTMVEQVEHALTPPVDREDPVAPFVGIVRAAIQKGHYDGANRIMRLVAFRVVEILKPIMSAGDEHTAYSVVDYFLVHLNSMLSSCTVEDLKTLRLPLDVLAQELWFPGAGQNLDLRSPQQSILRFALDLPDTFNDHVVQFVSQYGPAAVLRGAGGLAEASARVLRAKNLLFPVQQLVELLSRMSSASPQATAGYQQYLFILREYGR